MEEKKLIENFNYPNDFMILINQNLLDFDPWIILLGDRLKERYEGVKNRYPNRILIPFARREDNDDLACWNEEKKVVIIHDFASSGYEGGKITMSFWDWFRSAVECMIDYNSFSN